MNERSAFSATTAAASLLALFAGFAPGCATLPEGGHVDTFPITAVAFSPDGRYLAGGANKQVQVYEVAKLRLVKVLTLPEAKPTFSDPLRGPVVAWSNDGTMLAASGIADRTVVWDPSTGKEIRQLPAQQRARSIVFSPDGRVLATAGPDSHIRLWDIDTGTLARELAAHKAPAYSVAFSPDGRLLASSAADGTARIWDCATGNPIYVLRMDSRLVTGVAFSQDGTLLATAAGGYELKLWKAQTGEAAAPVMDVQAAKKKQVTANTMLSLLLLGGSAASVAMTGAGPVYIPVNPSQRPPACDPSVVFSPDGRLVATVLFQPQLSGDYHALIANLDTEEHLLISGVSGCGLAFSPDGKLLAGSSIVGAPNLWDPYVGKPVALEK